MSLDNLYSLVLKANQAYHDDDMPIMTDAEYDSAFHILKAKMLEAGQGEPDFVGAKSSKGFKKVKHTSRRLSLDNAFSVSDMSDFTGRCALSGADSFIAEPKIDGLSITLTYINGHFIRGVTRGDGLEGEDVTVNVAELIGVPQIIAYKGNMEATGEAYMSKQHFLELNTLLASRGEKLKANPRNAAAGTIRQHDIEAVRERNLSFFAYHVVFEDGDIFQTDAENMDFLQTQGFIVPPFEVISGDEKSLEQLYSQHDSDRAGLSYDVDGIVLKVNNLQIRKNMGIGSRTPYWGMAWKFDAEISTTQLNGITWQVGRTGALTPVAELEPIGIGGVIVSRATLHGAERFEELKPLIGCQVKVRRAGDVIPEIVEIIKVSDDFENIPTYCPCCYSDVERVGANIFCMSAKNGTNCRDRDVQSISYAVSRDVLNFENVGEGVIEKLYDNHVIHRLTNIFDLETDLLEEFRTVYPGRAGDKILKGINEGRSSVDFWRFISALQIPLVAKSTPKKLANLAGTPENFLDMLDNGYDFTELVGVARANNIREWWTPLNRDLYINLQNALNIISVNNEKQQTAWTGKTIVFTGTIGDFTRDGITEFAEKMGVKVSGSVSKKTDLVVYGESAGSKLEKATKLGVETMTAEEWLKTI